MTISKQSLDNSKQIEESTPKDTKGYHNTHTLALEKNMQHTEYAELNLSQQALVHLKSATQKHLLCIKFW